MSKYKPMTINGYKIWSEGRWGTIHVQETADSKASRLMDDFMKSEHSAEDYENFFSGKHFHIGKSESNKAVKEWWNKRCTP